MSYRWGLPHLAYFKALANETSEHNATWRSTLAGLAAMRLVDAWADGDPLPAAGIQALERAIKMMDVGAPERSSLTTLAAALCREKGGRSADGDSKVLEHVRDYAEVLWRSAAWTLAGDCCRTIVRHARTSAENAMIPLTYDRLGHCLRARGDSEAAFKAFETGRSLANTRADIAADLQLRISEASLELQRGHDTAAECMLDDVAVEATFAGLSQLGARAAHDRGVIAYRRGDTVRSLELFLRALAGYGDDVGAERALADIALVWLDQGHRDIARNIFQALARYSAERSQRWAATVNLLRIAVLDADEPLFETHCRTLSQAALSIRHEAHYHLFAAEGWIRFNRPTLAKKALGRAAEAIRRGGVAELETQLSGCKRELDALPRKRKSLASAPDQSRDEELAAHSAPTDFRPLMARTSAAALAWRGGRESEASGSY